MGREGMARWALSWRLSLQLLRRYSWPEWRLHPWRQVVAVLAVALGVALALSVHLINQSAMGEFSAAVRGVQGQADLSLRAARGSLPEGLLTQVAQAEGLAVASPVLRLRAELRAPGGQKTLGVSLWGMDALSAAWVTPAQVPQLGRVAAKEAAASAEHEQASASSTRNDLAWLAPDAIFFNAAARQALGVQVGQRVQLRVSHADAPPAADAALASAAHEPTSATGFIDLTVRGSVELGTEPAAAMDIAAVQDLGAAWGQLTRIDLRLQPGVDAAQWRARQAWPPGVLAERPEDSGQRVSELSRAYRVNLTVLALVALFTGGFLVFSVQALSVARRLPQWALLGVLGLGAAERRRLAWLEAALLGLLGAALGVGLGTALAALALALLGGDLGGGYFTGVRPTLQWSWGAALGYGALGVVAAVAGGWAPAATVSRLSAAQALKGLGLVQTTAESASVGRQSLLRGLALLVLAAMLSRLPAWGGVPWGAYAAVACLLLGGLALVPAVVAALLGVWPQRSLLRHASILLAVERARRQRHGAAVLMAGIVASLSLSVAITVMVASFRSSVITWLDVVLPADLYVRVSGAAGGSEGLSLPPDWPERALALKDVKAARGAWIGNLSLDATRPPITVIARAIDPAALALPMMGPALTPPPGRIPVYVSEAMVDLYGAAPGSTLALPLVAGQPPLQAWVAGVWRDYARQSGAIVMPLSAYRQASGDMRLTDLALWLHAPEDEASGTRTEQAMRQWPGADAGALQFARPREIRLQTLRTFDRSFAVTTWLQAVAIGIGLFGTAASFSAQVLARRKEFGLLAHLGFTRREVLGIVAAEGAALSTVGALVGLGLGLLISLVLVKVVNPQSFHWTMDMSLPWPRLLALCVAVLLAGTATAWVAGRRAVSAEAVRAVKEEGH
jgi:putative ABC transport system permease protein